MTRQRVSIDHEKFLIWEGRTYSPATVLITIVRNLKSTPVVTLQNTSGRLETLVLSSSSPLLGRTDRPLLDPFTLVDSRPRDRIRQLQGLLIDIVLHARAIQRVIPLANANSLGLRTPTTLHKDLGTVDIELGIRRGIRRSMQRQQLRSHQVVTLFDIRGDPHRQESVIVNQLLRAPLLGAFIVARMPDLEPSIACSVVVGCRIVDLLHVHGAGTLVTDVDGTRLGTVGPCAEFEGQEGVGFRGAHPGDGFFTILAYYSGLC